MKSNTQRARRTPRTVRRKKKSSEPKPVARKKRSSGRTHPVKRPPQAATHASTETIARISTSEDGDTSVRVRSHGRESLGGLRLSVKFALAIMLIVVLLIGVFGFITYQQAKTLFDAEIDAQGAHMVRILSALGYGYFSIVGWDTNLKRMDDSTWAKTQPLQKKIEQLRKWNKTPSDILDAYIIQGTTAIFKNSAATVDPQSNTRHSYEMEDEIIIEDVIFNGKAGRKFRAPIREHPGGKPVAYAELIINAQKIKQVANNLLIMTSVAAMAAVALSFFAAMGLSSIVTRPVRALVHDMNIVSSGNLNHRTIPQSNDEIGLLARTFNSMTKNLKAAQQVEISNHMLEHELNIASEIQARLLPKKIPRIQGFDIYAYYRSAKHVGGDYYDYLPIDNEHIGFIVADVSGKGIAGAMVMAQTRSIIRLEAPSSQSPAKILVKTNAILSREIRRGMFVTCMYSVLNVRTKTLVVASAGHNPMVMHKASTGRYELINPNGIALGFDKGPVFEKTIKEATVQMNRGDRFIMYTDGVVEAMNSKKEEFGEEHFYQLFQQAARSSSKELVHVLAAALDAHKGEAEQHDDITISTLMML